MVIINPGNPTGQGLSRDSLKELLEFCYIENPVLLVDEVYQQNIYRDEQPTSNSPQPHYNQIHHRFIFNLGMILNESLRPLAKEGEVEAKP